jgi:hypothetical protein
MNKPRVDNDNSSVNQNPKKDDKKLEEQIAPDNSADTSGTSLSGADAEHGHVNDEDDAGLTS